MYHSFNCKFIYEWQSGNCGAAYHVTATDPADLVEKVALKMDRKPSKRLAQLASTLAPGGEHVWDVIECGKKGHWQIKLWRDCE